MKTTAAPEQGERRRARRDLPRKPLTRTRAIALVNELSHPNDLYRVCRAAMDRVVALTKPRDEGGAG